MLFNPYPTSEIVWNRLQEPARPSRQPGDYLLLLSALDDGWHILEARRVISWGQPGQADFLILKLMQPARLQESELAVRNSPQIVDLLETQQVPVAGSLSVVRH